MGASGLLRASVTLAAAAVLVAAELDRRPDLAARLGCSRAMAEAAPGPVSGGLLATGTTELSRRLVAGDLGSARALAPHLVALAFDASASSAPLVQLNDLLAALDLAERTRTVARVLDDVARSLDRGPQDRLSLPGRRFAYHALARADLDHRYRAASNAELDLVLGEIAREGRPDVSARLVEWVGALAQERAASWLAALARDRARSYEVRVAALTGLSRIDRGRPVKVAAVALEPLAVDDTSLLAGPALDACIRLHHDEAAAAMRRVAAGLEHQASLTLRARVDYYANEQRRAASRLLAEERPAEALFAVRPLRLLAPSAPPTLEARCRALAGDPAGAVRLLVPFDDEASTAGMLAALATMSWPAVCELMDEASDERTRARWMSMRRRLPHLEARRDP